MEKTLYGLPTRELVLLPGTTQVINAGRTRSINIALEYLKDKNFNKIILITQKDPNDDDINFSTIHHSATICNITDVKKNNKIYEITIESIKRCTITSILLNKNMYQLTYDVEKEISYTEQEIKDICDQFYKSLYDQKYELVEWFKKQVNTIIKAKTLKKFSSIVDQFAENITIIDFIKTKHSRLEILQAHDPAKRLAIISKILNDVSEQTKSKKQHEEADKIEDEIAKKTNERLNKAQREFHLREKMKTIRSELAKSNPNENDIEGYRKKVTENPYPEYIKKAVLAEIDRLDGNVSHQDIGYNKAYIEWLLNLPFWQSTEDNKDLKKVEHILNESHYGLEKVKERITEYLAVRARAPKGKSPIICLVGPPGVGKTSLAISIAKALNKKFIKISLGGVKDVAEINGHRRTYVNAIPGRIIKGMKEVGVTNPLFLLDEIDKLSFDNNRGDAASALLEVLDPEQNKIYTDTYIEQPYDLSNVLFICTANYIEQIPEPLQDRMEIIELTSYTELEKLHIAKSHLVNKIYESTNTNSGIFSFSDEMLLYIIRHYTREAGVRELQRQLDKIARKIIKKISDKPDFKEKIENKKQIEAYLGKIIYDYTIKDENTMSGVVNGMAYTSAGGDLLPIEVTTFPGKGNISITGNLKETMKESVHVALSFVKSKSKEYKLDKIDFSSLDIHVHVPSGGIPKDGPSAGVTLTTAIISKLKDFKVPNNIAMTGEITLRGKVGVIGGIREKMISAFRGGVTEFFIPEANERDLINVPKEVKDNVEVNFVKNYDDIYKKIFNK